jgi:urease accessory protein
LKDEFLHHGHAIDPVARHRPDRLAAQAGFEMHLEAHGSATTHLARLPREAAEAEAANGFSETPWLIWQLLDSAFPMGGFGHSGGLEAAWQHGEVGNAAMLRDFIRTGLRQSARATVPIVNVAHREPARFAELDRYCDAWLSNHVANRASRLHGRAFWTAVDRALLRANQPAPEPGHLPPVFGLLLRRLGIEHGTTLRAFLFLQLRGVVSAAVRLGIVGSLEAQALQQDLAPAAEKVARDSNGFGLEDLAQTAPLLDIWHGAQDRLYSRLFQS